MEVANRISFIDQLKGITILLVVIGHLIEHNAPVGIIFCGLLFILFTCHYLCLSVAIWLT